MIWSSKAFGIYSLLIAMIDTSVLAFKPEDYGYDLVCETISAAGDVPILKYVSKQTGLHIIIAKVEGPLVQGYFTIATEARDNDGLPHTLEHLVFLGSEDYPYKGVLDLLANRCLADGTNAWTATDHTAYTVKTAGKAGFLNILPIYLDHLLYPTITESGFITEVYHITGKGEDAGVVYSEMQARENTVSDLTYNHLLKCLYPEPSGYRYETGGKMMNLRDSITHQKILDYHKAMYRPENLHVIIAGQVEPKDVFEAVKPIENKILTKGDRGPYEKPWQSPIPPFSQSADVEVIYASDDETSGLVRAGFRGPDLITELLELQSMEILMKYLCSLSISPLTKAFVENEDPLASKVSNDILEYGVSSLVFTFKGVPKLKINDIKDLLVKTLNDVANETIPFDKEVFQTILKNQILEEINSMEKQPHNKMAGDLIMDLLFGSDCNYLDKLVKKKNYLESLQSKPSSYWLDLVKKYFVSKPFAVIRGVPSKEEGKRLQAVENERVKSRVETLKEEGLSQKAKTVEEAKINNEIAPPDSMLQSLPVPSVANINYHHLETYSNLDMIKPERVPIYFNQSVFDMKNVPVKLQLDDIKSDFVQLIAVLDTSGLKSHQRKYLELVMELLLESPVQVGDVLIPHEQAIQEMNDICVSLKTLRGISQYSSSLSYGQFFNNVGVDFKVDLKNYNKGVEWLKRVLFNVVFDPERIKIKATKLLNSLGEHKRSGMKMLGLMYYDIVFNEEANPNPNNVLRQSSFLTKLLVDLAADQNAVVAALNETYRAITTMDNIVIHMATNVTKIAKELTNLTVPWWTFSNPKATVANYSFMPKADSEFVTSFDTLSANSTGFVAGMGSVESGYLYQACKVFNNFLHKDLPPLMTAISYLTQLEGPMWKGIRGKGLSYSYGITLKPTEGTLILRLARAAQLVEAYKEAHKIIKEHVNGTGNWDPLLFESARSSLIYEVIDRESDVVDVVYQSLLSYYRQVSKTYNRDLLQEIAKVTLKDMNRVAQKYFTIMIDPQQSQTFVVGPPSKVKEIQDGLTEMGHKLEVVEDLANSRFSN